MGTAYCWLLVFLKYMFTDAFNYEKAPSSHRGADGTWRWLRFLVVPFLRRTSDAVPWSVYCGPWSCWTAFKLLMCMPCVVWLLTPRGETSGLMGAVPRTGLPGRQTLLSASALGRRFEYRLWPTGEGCNVAHGARGAWAATREPTRSPQGRQCEYPSQGDHPQNWRATSQGPAVGVLALLWSLASV